MTDAAAVTADATEDATAGIADAQDHAQIRAAAAEYIQRYNQIYAALR